MKTILFILFPLVSFAQIPILLNMDLSEKDAREKLTEYDHMDDFYYLEEIPAGDYTIFSIKPSGDPALWISVEYKYKDGIFVSCTEVVPVNFLSDYRAFYSWGSTLKTYVEGSTKYYVWTYSAHVVTLRLGLADINFTVEYHRR